LKLSGEKSTSFFIVCMAIGLGARIPEMYEAS
jgi:hypothetical protein